MTLKIETMSHALEKKYFKNGNKSIQMIVYENTRKHNVHFIYLYKFLNLIIRILNRKIILVLKF